MSVAYSKNVNTKCTTLLRKYEALDNALGNLLEQIYDMPHYERRWVDDGVDKYMGARNSLLRAINRPNKRIIDSVNGELFLTNKFKYE